MGKTKKTIAVIFFTVLTGILVYVYVFLEKFKYSSFLVSGSTALSHFVYPSETSALIGYVLITVAYLGLAASLFKVCGFSRIWAILSFFVLGISIYGNSFLIFRDGTVNASIYEAHWYFSKKNIGECAKPDGETLVADSLAQHKYDGKLLGFRCGKNHTLSIYRINAKPVQIKTKFLFWELDTKEITEMLSIGGFSSYEERYSLNTITLVGGMEMPEDAFMEELEFKKEMYGRRGYKILDKKITNAKDGTTRLKLTVDYQPH